MPFRNRVNSLLTLTCLEHQKNAPAPSNNENCFKEDPRVDDSTYLDVGGVDFDSIDIGLLVDSVMDQAELERVLTSKTKWNLPVAENGANPHKNNLNRQEPKLDGNENLSPEKIDPESPELETGPIQLFPEPNCRFPLKGLNSDIDAKLDLLDQGFLDDDTLQALEDELLIDEERYQTPPVRRPECVNYQECLNIAACLNWESFTCKGCSGLVNVSLSWQARLERKKDPFCRSVFPAPLIQVKSGNSN